MRIAPSRAALLIAALAAGRAASADVARCEAAVLARPVDREAWRCFEVAGQSPQAYPEAARVLEAKVRARPGDPFPALALGRLEAGHGADRTVALLGSADEGFGRAGDDVGRAQALSSLVRYFAYRRRKQETAVALSSLRGLAGRSGAPEPRLELAVAEAFLAQVATDYGRAITLLRGVEDEVRERGHSVLRRGWFSTYAYVCWATGRRDEALAAYRRLTAMLEEENDRYRLASVLTDEVSIMTTPGAATPEERRRVAQAALDAARASGNLAAEAAALDYLADFDGAGPASAAAVARALEIARASGDSRAEGMALRAQCLYGEPRAAEAAFGEALEKASASGDRDEKARVLVVRSRMLWASGPRGAAIAASEAAMAAVEETRTDPPDGETRARRFGQWGRPYMELAGHLLSGDLLESPSRRSADDLERAFSAIERMRGRVLLDEMDAAGVHVPAGAGSDGLVSLREAQASLGSDEALLVYLLGDAPPSDGPNRGATSWVLAIVHDRVETRPVPDNLTLDARISLLTGLMDSRRDEEAGGAARLWADVVAPAVGAMSPGIRKLVIVPDRALYSLPFAALRPAPSAPTLGDGFEISVVPSASVWLRQRLRGAPPAPRGVLGVAAPGGALAGAPADAERGRPGASLPALTLAREEASGAVARIGTGSRLLAGSEASESALAAAGPSGYRVLHFAAHALLDDARPQKSAIVLTPDPPRDDGLLHLREIAALKLAGVVAVVSGCRSAGGLVLGGEGPVGLARAFFQAGARAVVGSLRPLRDDEAAAFFDRFYRHLGRGQSVAGAVRLAQRDRRKAGAPAAAWAGIVALGDGSAVPFPGGTRERWPWLAAGTFLAAGALWLLRSRLFR